MRWIITTGAVRECVSDGPSEDGQQRRFQPIDDDDRIDVSSRVDAITS
jgi:hypothetical protein